MRLSPPSLTRSAEPSLSSWDGAPPSEANLADFSLLRLLPRKDRLRRGKGQGHLFGVINIVSSANRALPLIRRFAASRRSATKSADARRDAAVGGELRQAAGAAASVTIKLTITKVCRG